MIFSKYNKNDNDDLEIVSVSEALRKHFGTGKVKGTLIGMSKLFKMISKVEFYCDDCEKLVEIEFSLEDFNIPKFQRQCDRCKKFTKNGANFEYKNAVMVELQDIDVFNDMDRLPVILFDNDTEDIRVGEKVIILGDFRVVSNRKGLFTFLYANSIHYLNRENFTLTKSDVDSIKRFATINKIHTIDKLVSMFDSSIVGYDHVKKGLLMSAVNTRNIISRNERINTLLIGDPGLAKSKLAKRITKLVPKSRHESGQSSSGKSLTAIIEKTDENIFLRPGPIPLASDAICSINELGRQSLEDQGHLLDVMEEGEFTKNAFGKNVKIKAPTTIVATANPINNSKWKDSDKVDLNEFPILEPIIDRFDLKFVFKDRKNLEEKKDFAEKLSTIEDKKDKGQLPDYTAFLIRYIQYARQINPILTEEARIMLREFYIKISNNNFGSPRILVTLPKLAKAVARLKLKEIVDEEDAKEVMEFYNVMLHEFQKQVVISQSPRDIGYQEGVSILEQCKEFGGISLEELFKNICQRNEQLANYFEFGKKSFKIQDNKKIRNIYEMLLNHSNIKKIKEKPIVLQWLSNEKNNENNPN